MELILTDEDANRLIQMFKQTLKNIIFNLKKATKEKYYYTELAVKRMENLD